MGKRHCALQQAKTLEKAAVEVASAEPKQVYAKVRQGWKVLYVKFFWPGTAQEDVVALEVQKVLEGHLGAGASVSEPCFGAMRGTPVMGVVQGEEPKKPRKKSTALSKLQLDALASMRNGAPLKFAQKSILTGRALLERGYVERATNMPKESLWLRITDAGRERLATMGQGIEDAG
jgi:hypothetical protein